LKLWKKEKQNTKIKLAHYITFSTDPHVELVRTYQDAKEEKALRSIIKDARTFATQLGLNITCDAECKETTVTSSSTALEANKCQPKNIKPIVKKEVVTNYENVVEQQPLVGHFTVKQWKNEDVDNRWCDISKVGKGIPSVVHSVHTGILQQLLQRNLYKIKKLKKKEKPKKVI